MQRLLFGFFIVIALGLSQVAAVTTVEAQGLVPACPAGQESCDNEYAPGNYGFCEVVSVVDNVLRLLVVLVGIGAVIITVYVGILFTVSQGDSAKLTKGKEMFVNIIVGLVIALTAYLIVSTILSVLVGDSEAFLSLDGIECQYANEAGSFNTNIVLQDFETLDIITGAGGDRISLGMMGADYLGGSSIATNPYSGGGGYGTARSCEIPTTGACTVQNLIAAGFGRLARDAAMIVGQESNCNPSIESRTDTTTDGRTTSVGVWQIHMPAHAVQCSTQPFIDCPSAFRRTERRNDFNVRMYQVLNEQVYQACVRALKDPRCNNEIAARLANRSGDMGDWACSAKKCGVYTTRNNRCPL